jgi:DNA modification methylase
VRSPKLATNRTGDWYRYYAGYAPEFVEDALDALELRPGAKVIDPWNGSGTTTSVVHARGFTPLGLDASPALVVIARARLLGCEVVESLRPLAEDILEHAASLPTVEPLEREPLESWLQAEAGLQIRLLERAIQHVLVDRARYQPPSQAGALDNLSALAAFFYVALFETLRVALRPFVGSNPTWVKVPQVEGKLALDADIVRAQYLAAVDRLAARLREHPVAGSSDAVAAIRHGDSTNLPLASQSIAGAITSPPYCTRIDYIISSRPELAVLGYGEEDLRALRCNMVGTPTISRNTPARLDDWGATVATLLARIEGHSSHASGTYYRKYFTQYFDSLWRSFYELRRVLRPNGRAIVVVQDSYYKEFRIDLATIVREMALSLGWLRVEQTDFPTVRTKAAINPGARSWRENLSATESALLLE